MADTKQKQEKEGPKRPVGEQLTDLVAAAAGALAENAVKSVARRVRKGAAKKTPEPAKKAVRSISKAAKAPKRTGKAVASKVVQSAKKATPKKASRKKTGNKAKKSRR